MNEIPTRFRVLVADDDVNLRRILSLFLRNAGYDTLEAVNGRNALDLIRSERPDAVILDVMMPVMDGFTVCRFVKESPDTRGIPIVICTAKNLKEDLVMAIRAGAEDYIVKPFTKETVLSKIEKVLSSRKAPSSARLAIPVNRRDSPRKATNWALSWGRKGEGSIAPIYKTRVYDVSLRGLSFEFIRCLSCTGYENGTVHSLCLFAHHARRFEESEPLDFVLSIGADAVVQAKGRIAHVYQWPDKPQTERVGVMFTEVSPEAHRLIKEYLEGPGH
jgi:CheY-like chemotaxis protein